MRQGSADFLHKEPCPECGSRDNLARYSDGHGFCFGCGHYEKAPSEEDAHETRQFRKSEHEGKMNADLITGEVQALPKRGITEETCRHFGYTVGRKADGTKVQLAPYYKDGKLAAQKYRTADKNFGVLGELKGCGLFGQQLWRDGGKMVVITEGEIDAMSVSQMQGNKWPVVSVPNGAQGAAKALKAQLEWLEKFQTIVLMFDMDDPGRAAVEECAALFTPGKCKIATLPLKDANEMLQAHRGSEIIDAVWGAKEFRPDGVVSASDIAEKAAEELPEGYPWFLPKLTKLTHGRRDGEVYALGAGTGVGKTDVFTQSIAFDLTLGFKVGAIYLEQAPVETLRRVAGKTVGKVLHVPGVSTQEERSAAVAKVVGTNSLYLYDHFGSTEWDVVKSKMRFMVVGLGCKMIYLDHLTALVAGEEDEKKALDGILADIAGLAKETGCIVHFISHLATPEGKPHEEGGRVMIRHFRGSRSIGFWSYFMFGLERNQQAEDEAERSTTTLRVLKDRNTGSATGATILLGYDRDTGMLFERSEDFEPVSPSDNEF